MKNNGDRPLSFLYNRKTVLFTTVPDFDANAVKTSFLNLTFAFVLRLWAIPFDFGKNARDSIVETMQQSPQISPPHTRGGDTHHPSPLFTALENPLPQLPGTATVRGCDGRTLLPSYANAA